MKTIKVKRSHRQLSCSCFICLEPVKLRGFNGEQLTSLNFLFKYLKIGNKVGPVVCEKCGENLVKFMKLGKTLEKVRLEMDYLLGVIQSAISKSNGGAKRAPVVLISVRECVSNKCVEKTWNARPEIILDRVDASSLLQTQSQTSKKCLIKKGKEKSPKIVLQRCDHFKAIKTTHQTNFSTNFSDVCAPGKCLGLPAMDSDICEGSTSGNNALEDKGSVTIPDGKTRRIRCPKCFETFSSKEILRQHLYVVHLHLKPFKCSTCSKSFSSETALRIHLDTAHVAGQVTEPVVKKCADEVPKSVLQNADVPEEQATIPDFLDNWVPNWDEDTSSTELGLPPEDSHTVERSEKSEISKINLEKKLEDAAIPKAKMIRAKCFKTFSSRPLMKRHFNAVHLHLKTTKKSCDKNKSKVRDAQAEKTIPCDICKKMFRTQILLRSHVFSVHEKRGGHQDHRYKMDIQTTNQETPALDSGYSEKLENGEIVFECDHCGRKLKSVSTVQYHIKAVHGPKTLRCPECDFATGCKRILAKHIENNHEGTTRRLITTQKRKRAKCDKCSKTFSRKSYLKFHNAAVHIRQRLHKCSKCDKAFTHRNNLWNHNNLVHLNPKRIRPMANCTKCSETFVRKKELRIHMNTVHLDPRPFKCSECEKTFAKEVNLRTHTRNVHIGVKPHMCEFCGKAFTNSTSLKIHKATPGIHDPKPQDPKKFPCPKCEKSYSTRKNLNSHKRNYHLLNGFKCDLCDKKYLYPQDLKRHVESFHEKIRYPCQVEGCDKIYTSERSLRSHCRVDHPELPEPPKKYLKKCENGEDFFECKICEKKFKSEPSVKAHVVVVHGPNFSKRVESFVCELCGYKTTYKQALQKHMDTQHHNDECFACEICSSPFNSTVALQMHVKSTHGPKEFKCSVCDKIFKTSSYLNRHVSTIHEKNRLYCQVEGCDKNYSQETDLFKHYKSQHPDFAITKEPRKVSKYKDMFKRTVEDGESVFECKLCEGKKFKTLQSIKLHIRNAHGRIEYKCQDCNFETVYKIQFEAHVRLMHKDRLGPEGDGESRPSLVLLV